MSDSIKIIASLNIEKSVKAITNDLSIIEKNLSTGQQLKIVACLNENVSIENIQKQLDTLSKLPKIKVDIDAAKVSTNKISGDINKQIQKAQGKVSLRVFDIDSLDKQGRKYFTKTTDIINRVKQYFQNNGALSVDVSDIENANHKIQSFSATVEDSTGVIRKYNFERAKIDTGGTKANYGFVQSDKVVSIDKNSGAHLKSTLNYLTKIDNKIATIQSKSIKDANPLKEGTVYYANYNQKLTETVERINDIRNANKTLSTEQKNEIDRLVHSLSLYAEEQQKLAYPPLMSSKPLEYNITENTAALNVLESKWRMQGILTDEFKQKVVQLREQLSQVGDTDSFKKFHNDFVVLKTDAQSLKSEFDNEKNLVKLSQNIDILRNRIIAFKNENTKSQSVFGNTYNNLLSELDAIQAKVANGIIDQTAFDKTQRGFRSTEKAVKAMGLTGQTVFESLADSAKKFTSWMSMTCVISEFGRNVRSAVGELKELDNIITEISKTSDRDKASLMQLEADSFDRASKYGKTASDYLIGIQEMSRAGFQDKTAEDMAELAVLAQSAGDMTADLANEYLIATNAAYKFNGDVEKLNSVLDSQNYITNRNALNLTELAEATKIVASQTASAGIGIDETTAAVGTMIATTQQGGEVAARAFKGIIYAPYYLKIVCA